MTKLVYSSNIIHCLLIWCEKIFNSKWTLVNLPKEGLEASATVGMIKEDGGHNPEPIVASAVTEPPFDDSIDDHEGWIFLY